MTVGWSQPFTLHERLGTGGTGVVFRATHPMLAGELALKLLRADAPIDEGAFLAEASATANLRHPHVVQIVDFGTWSGDPPDGVRPGAPYLATELLGASVAEVGGDLAWPQIRDLIEALLDALAHAHARGLVHRDVKPENVLQSRGGSWRLVDFGLADAAGLGGRVMGTPRYMAPEQFRGDDVGPWTDLFALGTLAWHLVTGTPPRSGTTDALLRAAARGELPELRPRTAVPDGLEAWLATAMASAPTDRFQLAADAAWSLAGLGESSGGHGGGVPNEPTWTGGATLADLVMDDNPADPAQRPGEAWGVPPVPERLSDAPPLPALPNAGASLVALGEPPILGRRAEQETLWSWLREAASGRCLHGVVWGVGGLGASRLVQWLARRAHEVGAAVTVDLSGLLTMSEAAAAVGRTVGYEISPTPWAIARAVAKTSHERSVVLIDDDPLPRSPSTTLYDLLTLSWPEARVLCLSTAASLPDHELALALLPLSSVTLAEVLTAWVGLAATDSRQLAEQAAGSPGRLVERVRELVRLGQLGPSESGLRVVQVGHDAAPSVAVAHRPLLELAAFLSPALTWSRWRAAATRCGLPSPEAAGSWALRSGVLSASGDGLAFPDPGVVGRLRRDAHGAGRSQRALEAAIATLPEGGDPTHRGELLLRAGRLEEACSALRQGAVRRYQIGDLVGSLAAFEQLESAASARGQRSLAAEALGWQAWLDYVRDDLRRARARADRVSEEAEVLDNDSLRASGAHTLSAVHWARCEAGWREHHERALDAYARCGDRSNARILELELALRTTPPVRVARSLQTSDDDPAQGWTLLMRATAWLYAGEVERGLHDAERALVWLRNRQQSTLTTRLLRMEALRAAGRHSEAHQDLQALLEGELEPLTGRADLALYESAMCSLGLGDARAAVARLAQLEARWVGRELHRPARLARAALVAVALQTDDLASELRWCEALGGTPLLDPDPEVLLLFRETAEQRRRAGDLEGAARLEALVR